MLVIWNNKTVNDSGTPGYKYSKKKEVMYNGIP